MLVSNINRYYVGDINGQIRHQHLKLVTEMVTHYKCFVIAMDQSNRTDVDWDHRSCSIFDWK